jgi:phosphatidylserine/phosphatidylglycerophosphate/cardiolipin synthase-like enzyme
MRYIVGCDKLIDQLFYIVETATKYIYLTSFDLDIEYENCRLFNAIETALNRGVSINIITTGLCSRVLKYNLLQDLQKKFPKKLHLKLEHTLEHCKEFSEQFVINTYNCLGLFSDKDYYDKLKQKTTSGLHLRYVGNENMFLLCGGNYSEKYSGSIYYDNSRDKYNYSWFDSGLLIKYNCKPTMKNIFTDRYSKVDYPFLTSGLDHYHYIIYRIHTSEKTIYFENQYFFSCEKITQNKIWFALANRLIKAIQNEEEFHFTLKTNFDCRDESSLRYQATSELTCISVKKFLIYIKSKTNSSDECLDKYISIYSSTAKTVIHSKAYTFDSKHILISSANIYDACFYSKGQQELGYIAEDNKNLYKEILKSIPNELIMKKSICELISFESDIFYEQLFNDNIISDFMKTCSIYYFLNLPLHKDIETFIFENKHVYKCDGIKYTDLLKRPEWLV